MLQKINSSVKFNTSVFAKKDTDFLIDVSKIPEKLSENRGYLEIIEWNHGRGNRLYIDYELVMINELAAKAHCRKIVDMFMKDGFNVLSCCRRISTGIKISFHCVYKVLGCVSVHDMAKYVRDNYGDTSDGMIYQFFLYIFNMIGKFITNFFTVTTVFFG